MLHTWVGFRNRLPAADARGGAPQVCALKIASILGLHTLLLSSVAGFRSGFTGQLWLPLFLEPPSTRVHACGGKSRRAQPVSEAKRNCGSFGNAWRSGRLF
jgi:hypothetical protein